MHRHGNHGLNFRQIYINHTVIICYSGRIQFLICIFTAVHSQISLRILIGSPYGRKTGCFRCHDINTISVIRIHRRHSGTYKFHDLIFNITILKYGSDQGNGNVMRSYGRIGLSVQIHTDNIGISDIIGIFQ